MRERAAAGLALVLLAALPAVVTGSYARHVVITALVFTFVALGLNLVFGYAGQHAFGHPVFFGVGAYASALLAVSAGWPVPLAIAGGAVLTALIAAAVGFPCFRLRGIYFGMATFAFARVKYASGNWDTDAKMPSNILNSLVEYTSIRVDASEPVVALDSTEIFAFPFVYLSGNELVRFTPKERENLGRYVHSGGFLFVDDCNHDVDGLFAKSFEAQVAAIFGPDALRKIPNDHAVYHSFFTLGTR